MPKRCFFSDRHRIFSYSVCKFLTVIHMEGHMPLRYSWCNIILNSPTNFSRNFNDVCILCRNLNQKLLAFLSLYFGVIWNYADTKKLPHLATSRQFEFAQLFVSVPLIKLKFYEGRHQPLKRAFD